MTRVSKNDMEMIKTARKYSLAPGKLKCQVFSLFDKGFMPREAKFLLRGMKVGSNNLTFAKTISRYYYSWKQAQKKIWDRSHSK